ncbi:MAG: M15 family metallopeptidase [Rubrivivax sp.]
MSSPVVLAAVLLYFAFVSLVLGLIMLPSWQDRAADLLARLRRQPPPAPAAPRAPNALQAALDAEPLSPRLGLLALMTAAVVAAGPITTLLLHEPPAEPLAAATSAAVTPVSWAETGSPRAVPTPTVWTREPAPAPAAGADIDRDWARLQPQFRHRLLTLLDLARERHGYEVVLLEGYRSPARQAQLAALGPTTTQAAPERSRHQSGLAADLAFVRDGRLQLSERDPWTLQAYRHLGEIATTLGLQWGGDWASLRDLGHVEWRGPVRPAEPGGAAPMLASAR